MKGKFGSNKTLLMDEKETCYVQRYGNWCKSWPVRRGKVYIYAWRKTGYR